MVEYTLPLSPDMKGVLDSLIENVGLTSEELINLGIILYHRDIFIISKNIENVKLWLFLDKTEQKWLKAICEYYDKSQNEIIEFLISSNTYT